MGEWKDLALKTVIMVEWLSSHQFQLSAGLVMLNKKIERTFIDYILIMAQITRFVGQLVSVGPTFGHVWRHRGDLRAIEAMCSTDHPALMDQRAHTRVGVHVGAPLPADRHLERKGEVMKTSWHGNSFHITGVGVAKPISSVPLFSVIFQHCHNKR